MGVESYFSVSGLTRPSLRTYGSPLDVFGFGLNIVAAVIIGVLGGEALVNDDVVIALVEDEDAVVLEHGIKLGQGPAAVFFVEHVGKGVAEADDRIKFAVYVAVEKAPIGLHRAQDMVALVAVLKGFGQHFGATVGADDFEACL